MATTKRMMAEGDHVRFEGLDYTIVLIADDKVEFHSVMKHTDADGNVRPRFMTVVNESDMRWSAELGAWYLWGRLLSKGRGARNRDIGDFTNQVGVDERKVVAALRDRNIIPARATRARGDGPVGGEHFNLHTALFTSGIDWGQELENVKRGEGLSTKANAAVAKYKELFKTKLVDGYASAGADDSWAE